MKKPEELVLDEVLGELNWKEEIIVKVFPKTFIKIYGIAGKNIVNQILK